MDDLHSIYLDVVDVLVIFTMSKIVTNGLIINYKLFYKYIYRKIKNTFMEEKEVAQGLFDGGVRKTFCGKKEMYVALMAEPTFSQFSKFMPVSKKDEVSAMRTLIKDCFIEGDHELVNNNFRFLFGLMGQLTDLLSPARARS